MGHVQKLSTFLFVLALALLWGGSVRAASFSASLSVEEGRPGTQVEARFFYNGTLSGVAALRIRLEYDPEVLRFQEVQYGDQLEKGEAATKNEDGVLSTVVTLPGEETSLDIGDLLVCSFLVRGDAPLEKTLLRASVFQVVDGNSEPVQEGMETELALQVLPPPSTDARLLSLVPETGQLTPAFHPEVLEYRLSVPFEVTSMTFAAQPAEGGVLPGEPGKPGRWRERHVVSHYRHGGGRGDPEGISGDGSPPGKGGRAGAQPGHPAAFPASRDGAACPGI